MELTREEHARLRAAGTMIDLEELACEIGDEFTRQLMEQEMADRLNEAAEASTSVCPDCGNCCGPGDSKLRKLASVRGEIHYCEGLLITSSHIESTVKLINRRIKGSEKFWLQAKILVAFWPRFADDMSSRYG